ncbi:hypothetical protein [Gordonia crocea]|uniref:HNH endonuclease n=1 Tax=Gordonia crocea TaxID=589162 RepID=A0A7I9V0Y0_9ACTN|nr:hypothetical protein [Gordonia crocea]GED98822.1 hypothetical protein nbrc107697_28610 [Gordonia crocea]
MSADGVGKDWSCRACGSTAAEERDGRARFCRDCLSARGIFRTTQGNLRSGFNRTNKGSPVLGFNIDEFCRWRKAQTLRCAYCGIRERDLSAVGMRSQIQREVRVLGVDRIDSGAGYVLANLVPCCFVCNQIKGDRFTAEEMQTIGPAIGQIWSARLAGRDGNAGATPGGSSTMVVDNATNGVGLDPGDLLSDGDPAGGPAQRGSDRG